MMRKEQILLELLRNLKEINQKLDKIEEERTKLVMKLLENDVKIVETYDKLAKLEPTIEVLWEIEIENKLELLGENLN